jgi:hypothetical protein
METNTNTNKSKAFYKSKLFIIPMVALMLMGIVAAAIAIATLPTTVNVNEAFIMTSTAVTFTGVFADGMAHQSDVITIDNKASVPLNAQFTYAELTNEGDTAEQNTIAYTTDADGAGKTVILAPGVHDYYIGITIPTGEDSGDITGTVQIDRIA